jgi:hypothetical protein
MYLPCPPLPCPPLRSPALAPSLYFRSWGVLVSFFFVKWTFGYPRPPLFARPVYVGRLYRRVCNLPCSSRHAFRPEIMTALRLRQPDALRLRQPEDASRRSIAAGERGGSDAPHIAGEHAGGTAGVADMWGGGGGGGFPPPPPPPTVLLCTVRYCQQEQGATRVRRAALRKKRTRQGASALLTRSENRTAPPFGAQGPRCRAARPPLSPKSHAIAASFALPKPSPSVAPTRCILAAPSLRPCCPPRALDVTSSATALPIRARGTFRGRINACEMRA